MRMQPRQRSFGLLTPQNGPVLVGEKFAEGRTLLRVFTCWGSEGRSELAVGTNRNHPRRSTNFATPAPLSRFVVGWRVLIATVPQTGPGATGRSAVVLSSDWGANSGANRAGQDPARGRTGRGGWLTTVAVGSSRRSQGEWAQHHRGNIRPAGGGEYRFSGGLDTALAQVLNGRIVFCRLKQEGVKLVYSFGVQVSAEPAFDRLIRVRLDARTGAVVSLQALR